MTKWQEKQNLSHRLQLCTSYYILFFHDNELPKETMEEMKEAIPTLNVYLGIMAWWSTTDNLTTANKQLQEYYVC